MLRPLSPIELLPAEILQNIFLRTWRSEVPSAREANFPLSSLAIAHKLSDYYILSLLCDEAITAPFTPGTPYLARCRERDERAKFQQRLFGMRWMDWGFFEWYIRKITEEGRGCGCAADGTCCKGVGRCKDPARWERARFLVRSEEGEGNNGLLPHLSCWIPDKLLRAPFTEDNLAFLTCLLKVSKMSVNWASRESVNLTTLAKHTAVRTKNLPFVQLFSRTRRLCRAPNLGLVKYAVMEAGCERSIVFELMSAARQWGCRRWQDEELDERCKAEEGEGNLKGAWVRMKLGELRGGGWPDARRGDYEALGDVLVVEESGLGGRGCIF